MWSFCTTIIVGKTHSAVPALPVICDLWPNLARKGTTKGVLQQIAAGAKQKPPQLMRQKARGSPTNPQELPNAAQTKPEIKKSQRQAHFYSRAKGFLFHGLGGFPARRCNRADKRNNALPFSVTEFEKAGFSSFFSLLFSSLSTITPTTLCGLILKVLKPPLVAFRWCRAMFNSYFILHFNLSCLWDHTHLSLLFVCKAGAQRMLSLRGHEMKRLYSKFTNLPLAIIIAIFNVSMNLLGLTHPTPSPPASL